MAEMEGFCKKTYVRYGRYLIEAALLLIALGMYYGALGMTGVLSWKYGVRTGLIAAAVFTLAQVGTAAPLSARPWRCPVILFLLWSAFFPFFIGQHAEVLWAEQASPYVLTGLFLAVALYVLRAASPGGSRRTLLCRLAAWVVLLAPILAMVVYGTYFAVFGGVFSVPDMITALLTNEREAEEFFSATLGWGVTAALVVLIVLLGAGCWYLAAPGETGPAMTKRRRILLAVVLLSVLILGIRWGRLVFPLNEFRRAHSYIVKMERISATHEKALGALTLTGGPTAADALPGTVLVIIGESANRDHMQAFNPSYPAATTPWLSSKKGEPGWYLFPHSYANYTYTAQALAHTLTSASQYNGQDPAEAVTLTDLANLAGYETWFISNQEPGAQVISLLANESNHALWVTPQGEPDGHILPTLADIPAAGSHFAVIHLEGSHLRYEARVPQDFPHIDREGVPDTVNDYDSSICYTDSVLRDLFHYARDHLRLQALVYVSDHGEDMTWFHGGGRFTWDMVRIPFFIWLSPEYREAYPDVAARLEARQGDVFTNDLLYDTISGLLQAPNTAWDGQYDLTSDQWSFTADQALAKGIPVVGDEELVISNGEP